MTKHKLATSQRPTVAAVGEFAYTTALSRVPGGIQWVELVPEPDNPHDNHAISVRWHGNVIAYLPRQRTATYWPNVARIAASGRTPTAKAKIYHGSGDFHEVSLFLLAGDKGLGSTAGLVAKQESYKVPPAYKGKTASSSFTDQDRRREAERRKAMNEELRAEPPRGSETANPNTGPFSSFGCAIALIAATVIILIIIF